MFNRYFYAEEYPRTAGSRSTIKKTAETTVVSYMYNYNMVYEKCIYSPFSQLSCVFVVCVYYYSEGEVIVKGKYNIM